MPSYARSRPSSVQPDNTDRNEDEDQLWNSISSISWNGSLALERSSSPAGPVKRRCSFKPLDIRLDASAEDYSGDEEDDEEEEEEMVELSVNGVISERRTASCLETNQEEEVETELAFSKDPLTTFSKNVALLRSEKWNALPSTSETHFFKNVAFITKKFLR